METLDRSEFRKRMKALDEEEKKIAVKCIETDILRDELTRRELAQRQLIAEARKLFKVEEEEE